MQNYSACKELKTQYYLKWTIRIEGNTGGDPGLLKRRFICIKVCVCVCVGGGFALLFFSYFS